jgi:hypothetical protein
VAGEDVHAAGTELQRRRAAKKAEALILLGEGRSYSQVAESINVGVRTIARWVADDVDFRAELSDLRSARTAELAGRMVGSVLDVVEVIHDEAFGGERSADRIRAAGLYVQLTLRLRHEVDMESRVRRMEEVLGLAGARPAEGLVSADEVGREQEPDGGGFE